MFLECKRLLPEVYRVRQHAEHGHCGICWQLLKGQCACLRYRYQRDIAMQLGIISARKPRRAAA